MATTALLMVIEGLLLSGLQDLGCEFWELQPILLGAELRRRNLLCFANYAEYQQYLCKAQKQSLALILREQTDQLLSTPLFDIISDYNRQMHGAMAQKIEARWEEKLSGRSRKQLDAAHRLKQENTAPKNTDVPAKQEPKPAKNGPAAPATQQPAAPSAPPKSAQQPTPNQKGQPPAKNGQATTPQQSAGQKTPPKVAQPPAATEQIPLKKEQSPASNQPAQQVQGTITALDQGNNGIVKDSAGREFRFTAASIVKDTRLYEHDRVVFIAQSNGSAVASHIHLLPRKQSQGVITWFDATRYYGTIKQQDGQTIYFHVSDVEGNVAPQEGLAVRYQVTTMPDQKGLRPVHIQIEKGKN